MSQHLFSIYVTNSIDTLYRCLEIIIYRNTLALIILKACLCKISLYTGLTTCSHQDDISIYISQVLNGCLHLKDDTLLLQRLTQALSYVAVQSRQTFLQELNYRYL